MHSSNRRSARSLLLAVFAGLPLAACAASEPPPAVAPPPAAPATGAPVAPAAPAAQAASAPNVAEEANAPEPKKPNLNHRHPLVALFLASVDSLDMTAQQKAAIDGVKADLLMHAEVPKEPRRTLEADVLAAVNAGKFDQPKIDADMRAMASAVAATQPAMQDDLNHLHRALNPEQRKKLVEIIRGKAKEMHAHGMAMHEHGHAHAAHDAKSGEHEHQDPLAKLGEELSLTPEQSTKIRAKVEALVNAQQAAMKNKMAAAQKQMEAVATAFITEKFDAKKLGIGTQAPELVKTVVTERVQFVQAVLPELTPEQRSKFAAHIQAHNAEID